MAYLTPIEMGAKLRSLREASGLSSVQLAAKANKSLSYIAKLEAGQVPNPTLNSLEAVALAVGVTVEELRSSNAEPSDDRFLTEMGKRLKEDPEFCDVVVTLRDTWPVTNREGKATLKLVIGSLCSQFARAGAS